MQAEVIFAVRLGSGHHTGAGKDATLEIGGVEQYVLVHGLHRGFV